MDLLATDMTKVAGAFSTFAGVLAGFVFAFMGYLLGSRTQRGRPEQADTLDTALSWSVLAFVSLSVTAFLFALESGEDRFAPSANGTGLGAIRMRPLAMHVVASSVLSTSIVVLLIALTWLFRSEAMNRPLMRQLRLVVYLTGLMTLYYFDGTFGALLVAQGQRIDISLSTLIPLSTVSILAIAGGELVGLLLRKAARVAIFARIVAQTAYLLIVFAIAGYFYVLTTSDEATIKAWNLPAYEWWGVSGLGFVLFLCILSLPGLPARERGDKAGAS